MHRNRLPHHLTLAGITLACVVVATVVDPVDQFMDRLSIVSAYLCMALLCAVLSIGPWHALRTGRPYVNNHLRRDIGIWAGLLGLVHLFVGIVVSMTPVYIASFVDVVGTQPSAAIRNELFVWGTIAGLSVGILVLLLLTISNDKALRVLGPRWWKRLHRTSYIVFVLMALHGLAFQVLESRAWGLILLLVAATAAILVLQIAGARAVKNSADAAPACRSS